MNYYRGKTYDILATENDTGVLAKAVKELDMLIKEGIESPLFAELLQNAENYKNWLEHEWATNKDKINKELTNIMKVDLPKETFTVYVMGDLVHVGKYLRNHNITWGHKEDWKNYSLVYLIHESLHELFSHSDLDHAVIELATDNELRIRLNGGGGSILPVRVKA
jgi:hypothetical protein